MASYGEWCDEKLSQLSNEDTRLPVLKEMMDHLTSMPRNEMSRAANSLQLPLIFDCLNDSNTEQVDVACEVLSLCMTNLNLGESTNKYGVFLERALNHPFVAVKLMALSELKRNIENDDILVDLCKRKSLLNNIIKCVGDSDLSVAKMASDIIVIIGVSSVGITPLVANETVRELRETMTISEIVRLRMYEMLIQISVQSETSFNALKSMGLISLILEELDNNDVLFKLNILQLLTQLGTCKYGYEYLESTETLKKLSNYLDDDDLVNVQLCEPGVLKFFGSVAHWKPLEVLPKYSKVLQRICDNLEHDDFVIMGVSLDTLGHFGLPNNGKIALDATGALIENAIKTISKSLPSSPTEIKIRALNCLENLLRVLEFNTQVTIIARKWYCFIDDDPITFIWNYGKNPFAEIRLAGFGVLNSIAGQSWGQEAIRNTPGLIEFILNRNVETNKECKEAKYDIVKLLAASSAFDHATAKRLETFTKEGPFYVQALAEVAVERNE